MAEFHGDNFDEIYQQIVFELMRSPQYVCSPRGQTIKEGLASTLILSDPTARVLMNPARETNYGFAVGEFIWYWQGAQDLQSMLYYNKRMGGFSDDGVTLNSSYGYRMRRQTYGPHCTFENYLKPEGTPLSQWDVCILTLMEDPDSRRAVLLINGPIDQVKAATIGSKDVPCTLSLQFFVRDGLLHLHTHMRSNDVIWGLTYDLFSFTLFQEMMLLELRGSSEKFSKLGLGSYYHTAGSLHIYDRHFDLSERIIRDYDRAAWETVSGRMDPITSINDLNRLCVDESLLRTGEIRRIDETAYGGGLRWMAKKLNEHREKRDDKGHQL